MAHKLLFAHTVLLEALNVCIHSRLHTLSMFKLERKGFPRAEQKDNRSKDTQVHPLGMTVIVHVRSVNTREERGRRTAFYGQGGNYKYDIAVALKSQPKTSIC